MGKAKLISATLPQGIPEAETLEDLIVYCARVSNPNNQNKLSTKGKLLRFLIREKHWSPFEMASLCIEIKTTRDIARQILRHRSFSFQEFSQRYAETHPSMQFRECRLQDVKNRQNSIPTDWAENRDLIDWFSEAQNHIQEYSFNLYEEALSKGIAKEQARIFLPEGLTSTTLYMSGTLRSWIHYLELRLNEATQKEHREVAKACFEEVEKVFPLIGEIING